MLEGIPPLISPPLLDSLARMGYGEVLLVVDENVQEPRVIAGMQQGDPGWGVEPAEGVGLPGVGDRTDRVTTQSGRYQDLCAGMRDAVRDRASFPVDPADAVAALRVIEHARTSALEQRVVRLEGTR